MATGLETEFMAAMLGTFGNPIFMAIALIFFFVVILIFGRVGMIASTPVMVGVLLLSFEFMPQFRIPFAIIFGIILGYGFYRIYRG